MDVEECRSCVTGPHHCSSCGRSCCDQHFSVTGWHDNETVSTPYWTSYQPVIGVSPGWYGQPGGPGVIGSQPIFGNPVSVEQYHYETTEVLRSARPSGAREKFDYPAMFWPEGRYVDSKQRYAAGWSATTDVCLTCRREHAEAAVETYKTEVDRRIQAEEDERERVKRAHTARLSSTQLTEHDVASRRDAVRGAIDARQSAEQKHANALTYGASGRLGLRHTLVFLGFFVAVVLVVAPLSARHWPTFETRLLLRRTPDRERRAAVMSAIPLLVYGRWRSRRIVQRRERRVCPTSNALFVMAFAAYLMYSRRIFGNPHGLLGTPAFAAALIVVAIVCVATPLRSTRAVRAAARLRRLTAAKVVEATQTLTQMRCLESACETCSAIDRLVNDSEQPARADASQLPRWAPGTRLSYEPQPRSRRARRTAKAVIAASALPGMWLLWSAVTRSNEQLSAVPEIPLVAQWIRGTPKSVASVTEPAFFRYVMFTGLVLASIGLILALPALTTWALSYRRSYVHRGWKVAAAIGTLLVIAAHPAVTYLDKSVARSFERATGSEYHQLRGSCWFRPWVGDSVPGFKEARRLDTSTLPNSHTSVLCHYQNFASWERRAMGFPDPNNTGPPFKAAIIELSTDGYRLMGAVTSKGDFSFDPYRIDNEGIAHFTVRNSKGSPSNVVECATPLDPQRVQTLCE